MRGFRLQLEDVRLFPVQACFNAPSDDQFLKTIEGLADRIGFGWNDAGCIPSGTPDGDGPDSGVLFYLRGYPDVIISDQEMLGFLAQALSAHASRFEADRARAAAIYKSIEAGCSTL